MGGLGRGGVTSNGGSSEARGTGSNDSPPAPSEDAGEDADAGGALPMDLRFSTQRIVPGTAADMRGTLGPNASGATVAVTFSGRMSPGMVYRSVDVEVDDRRLDCRVGTTTFSCLIPLDPGAEADVGIRVYADPVNAPDTAVQQLSVQSNRDAQANALTVTTALAKSSTEASRLADVITTFNVTEFPGAMVPLLAMLLFALAATVAGRRTAAVAGPDATPPVAGPDATPPGGPDEPPPAPARPTTR